MWGPCPQLPCSIRALPKMTSRCCSRDAERAGLVTAPQHLVQWLNPEARKRSTPQPLQASHFESRDGRPTTASIQKQLHVKTSAMKLCINLESIPW